MSQDASGIRFESSPSVIRVDDDDTQQDRALREEDVEQGPSPNAAPTPQLPDNYQRVDLDISVVSTVALAPSGARMGTPPPAARQSESEQQALPDFKDQTRSNSPGAAQQREKAALKDDSGPDFKDQVSSRGNRSDQLDEVHSSRGNISDQPDTTEHQAENPPSPSLVSGNLFRAHLVDDEDSIQTAVAMTFAVLLQRRSIITIAVVLLITAAIVGGVCGATGMCIRKVEVQADSPTNAPTTVALPEDTVDFVNNVTKSGRTLVYPPPSVPTAEELALQWLIETDPAIKTLDTLAGEVKLLQRYTLATLYFSTDGPSWTNSQGFLTDPDECNWQGIACDATGDHITELSLEVNNLRGTLPSDLAQLSLLAVFDVHANSLSGTIPDSLSTWQKLTMQVM